MLANKLMSALSGGAEDKLYVDDVFSAYTYTGNGSTQTINNGIDLAGKGGLVWIKGRSGAARNNVLADSTRDVTLYSLSSNSTSANLGGYFSSALGSTGFSVSAYADVNQNTETYVSWTFRKAPKFFDVVTFTAGTNTNRRLSHSLGQTPGMVLLKRTDAGTESWAVYHSSLGRSGYLILNNTAPTYSSSNVWGTADPTISDFGINETYICTNASTCVAYLFAHDTSADGVIQCGSVTTDGSGNATVNLGWEPQYVLTKNSGSSADWEIVDGSRPFPVSGNSSYLKANATNAEAVGSNTIAPKATGFSAATSPSQTYIYLAIRRSNKPPTTGTQVYNAIARTGTGAAATVTGVGFSPDLVIHQGRANLWSAYTLWLDKLRGARQLYSQTTGAEEATNSAFTFTMDGFSSPITDNYSQYNGASYIEQCFKRAPGFMDVVCYTGTGAARTVTHSLGVAPELMIVKKRSAGDAWMVYQKDVSAAMGATNFLSLNTTAAQATGSDRWNTTAPTASVFSVGNAPETNQSTATYVNYLFATKAGISKVGSYTGNGSSQTINCGFTTGARFILIKRTDSTGDWYVWDTARGIVSANDPHLSLNTTASEVTTDDSVDPTNEGFIVNNVSPTNINVTGGSYIFLAIS